MKLDSKFFSDRGLNLQEIINLSDLPQLILDLLEPAIDTKAEYSQLIVLGHGGKDLWHHINQQEPAIKNPIDTYSLKLVEEYFSSLTTNINQQIIYPGKFILDLQVLGKMIGWHFDSPLKIGINPKWGTWFAYRVVMLANTTFEPTLTKDDLQENLDNKDSSNHLNDNSPCLSCSTEECISNCPAQVVSREQYDLKGCLNFRKQTESPCKSRCIARMNCPAGKSHQYSLEQIQYHYGLSKKFIGQCE
ncbi:MAG: hypothetical protein OEY19_08420 [Gammaproteobacteria bacterium]|nr:hypothetical protein [Gammaproteobacteria bacterium]MDH5630067.1 hypothetical protein [Gammaproteobacteria bacterium]